MSYLYYKEFDFNSLEVGKKYFIKYQFYKINNCKIYLNDLFLRNYIGLKINGFSKNEIYFIDLEFKQNNEIYNFFNELENYICNIIKNNNNSNFDELILSNETNIIDHKTFVSCIFENEFDYFIRLKIPTNNLNFNLEYLDKNNNKLNIEDININKIVDCYISCNGIWTTEKGYGISWNIDKLISKD